MTAPDAPDLTSSAAHMRGILGTVGEGIITIDASETILFMNEEAERIWGIEPGEYRDPRRQP